MIFNCRRDLDLSLLSWK